MRSRRRQVRGRVRAPLVVTAGVVVLAGMLALGALGALVGLGTGSDPAVVSPDAASADVLSPPGGLLYVANLRSSEVTAVDVSRGTIVARWAMAVNPHEFAAAGSRLYVSNYRSAQISTIALDADIHDWDGVRTQAAGGPRPHGLDLDAAGVAWWTTADGWLRSAAGETIAVGAVPHALVIDRARELAYVAEAGAGTVAQVALGAQRVRRRAAAGALVESVALDGSGETLLAAAADGGRVTAFAAADLSERWRTSLAGRPVRVLVAGDRVLVSLALSGKLAILDLATGAVLSMVPVGLLPDGIAVEASGRYASVASAGSDRVVVVALAAGTVVGELPAGEGPSGLLWVAGAW